MHAFPTDSAAGRRMNGALHAGMSRLMKEVTSLRVWDGSRLEGSTGLRFAVEKLSVSMASRGVSSSSFAFLTEDDSISTARTGDSTASTGELSSSTVDELLYASGGTVLLEGEFLDELSLICPGSLSVLHEVSLRVIRAGYTEELLDTFTHAPCDILDRFLSILQVGCSLETGRQVMSYENADWWTAEEMIRRWILATKLVERALVAMQTQLHAQSNGAFDRFKKEYLMAIAKRSTSVLLRFAHGFTGTRSPEKLMCVFEMYEVLGDLVPSLLLVFTGQRHKEPMSRLVEGVLAKLARALRAMMGGLVTKIRTGVSSGSGTPSATGVHPLTRCTMACIGSLAPHHAALDLILSSTRGDDGDNAEDVNSFGDLVSELIASLEANLLEISSTLRGVDGGGLWHLFQANNTGFVLKHADVLEGDDWAGWRQSRVERHVRGYVQASWAPVVACLKSGRKADVKILGKFNSALEKAYSGHARCEVPDPALRAALRKAVSDEVVVAYDAYLLRHHRLRKSARYTTESLAGLLSELFEG
uniref:Uncharacterized protein n=1 Tax=Avena sativa TaxID=4498 RepID=A0ACD5UIF8_AVESA